MLFTSTITSMASALSLMAFMPPITSTYLPASEFPVMPRQTNSSYAQGVSLPRDIKKFYAEAVCNHTQKMIEQYAWKDALQYAQALASWRVNTSYQAAMDMYMGNDSRGPLGDVLEANIIGAANVHTNFTWPKKEKLFILCEEPQDIFQSAHAEPNCILDTIAYEISDLGEFYDNHYIVFCPPYYTYPSLTESLRTIGDGVLDHDEHRVDSYMFNRGYVYFHESLHLADLTTPLNHSIGDSATDTNDPFLSIYGAQNVVQEAKTLNTAACLHTADAYSCAAAAILAQQKFHLVDPPIPADDVTSARLTLRSNFDIPLKRKVPEGLRVFLPDPNTEDNHIENNRLNFKAAAADIIATGH